MMEPFSNCSRCNGTGIATDQHDFCSESGPCECMSRDERMRSDPDGIEYSKSEHRILEIAEKTKTKQEPTDPDWHLKLGDNLPF